MSQSVAKRSDETLVGRLEHLRQQFQGFDPAQRGDLSALRHELERLRTELDPADAPGVAGALERVGLLAEVCECFAAEVPQAAREVADFCSKALEQVASVAAVARDDGSADGLAWILEESKSRWSQYLGLLDEDLSDRPEAPAEVSLDADRPAFEDDPSEIAPEDLLRMLIGTAPRAPAKTAEPPRVAAGEPRRAPRPLEPALAETASLSSPPLVPEPRSIAAPAPRDVLEGFPTPPARVDLDPDLREAFLAEATDLFERIEALVLGLDQQADPSEALHELGRCYHTLKGAAGSVGLLELASLVHSLEERLDGPPATVTTEMTDLFMAGLRYLEGILQALGGGPAPVSAPARMAEPAPRPGPPSPRGDAPASPAEKPAPAEEPATPQQGVATEGPLRVPSARIDDLMDLVSELITRRGLWMVQADSMKEFALQSRACRNRLLGSIDRFHDLGLSRENGPAGSVISDARADVPWLIRRLSEQAEDLAVLTDTAQAATIAMADHRDALDRLTLQLWEALQAIRITPVRGLFQRLARVAHDAARVEARKVEVVMVGEDSGLDRAVQDKAFEPMLHMVRNAVGHGIEPPADRVKAGKSPIGRVILTARREGNTLVLSVGDDGQGLDYAAIEAKGRRLGLLKPDETPSLNRLNALVFQPGFSTREEANAISGRGVGMDVVSQEVARLHGTIDLASQTGLGTTLTLRLPVRLALERVMIVRIDGQAFALPIALVELAQPFEPGDQDGWGADATVRVRGRGVPLIDAREALGFSATAPTSNPKLLLVRADEDSLALLVDSIEGTRELVLRPLGPLLAGHPVISGTGLSINGEAILALNPTGMSRWLRSGGVPVPVSGRKFAARQAPILVVDDSISVRRVVTRNLRSLGYEVEEVSHGLEALGKLRNQTYSMVLTDLEMPHLDGFELLAELARVKPLNTLPVVVASTKCDPETRRRILELGARAFLTKPVEPEVLANVILPLLHPVAGVPASSAVPIESNAV